MEAPLRRLRKLVWLIGLTTASVVAPEAPAATARNPVLFADYSDPDVVRAGADYYMVASSFQCVPALPILHSRDLVNWTLIGHAAGRLPSPDFDVPRHGNGMWAPSLRHHAGFFWIYVGDPDRGIFMTRARDPRGPWEPLTLVREAKGWIDPCPLWDDDGSMYLVHAWARSRAGFNGVLTVHRMSADGRRVLDEGTVVFDGRERHPTIEGPKFYKRNGWYYIFAPAGGVKNGWQTVLRSKNVFGPYEDKIALEQGSTRVNGPHQGAWVDSWFVHFQDRGAYGRVVHLQPLAWVNDWPVIGEEGEPVEWVEVRAGADHSVEVPAASPAQRCEAAPRSAPARPPALHGERGDTAPLDLDWQWHGNPSRDWYSLRGGDVIRLTAIPLDGNLWSATNLLLRKLPAPAFAATARLDASGLKVGERAGLLVMGLDYSALVVERDANGLSLRRVLARDADTGSAEQELDAVAIDAPVYLRVTVAPEAVCRFSYSRDGTRYEPLGVAFVARPGRWIGAKVGLFASRWGAGAPAGAARAARRRPPRGYADFADFRIEPFIPADTASLVVARDGSGDFRTVQEAVDAIPAGASSHHTILIRNGVYREKVRIVKSRIALVGEDREKTRIEYAELRRNWRANHPDDWGAAVINIADGVTDVVIANLTVRNDYGSKHGDHDHQFAIRSMGSSTRIAVLHANVIAGGGDTFSPWNSESGLTYATDSYFEGWVDYVCPRGWAYITSSRFFGHNMTASIWHDGSKEKDQKFVIRNSHFDGRPGFPLGRNHRDAQFYLVDASFSPNMADRPIHPADAPDPRQWGERYYYANTRRDGGDFDWFADNLHTAEGSPRSEDITATWTFGGRWDPATLPAVLPFAAVPQPENGWRFVDRAGVTLRWTPARNATAQRVHFGTTDPPPLAAEQEATRYATGALKPGAAYYWRVDSVIPAGVVEGPLWSFAVDARPVRIVLAGDSTVTEKSGWGAGFRAHVAESAAVINLARGGRSSKSFISEGHWQDVLRREPTHVLIQFGHNDQPGKGAGRETDLPEFRANLARYVDEARAIGAKPILVTPLVRRNFRGAPTSPSATMARADGEVGAPQLRSDLTPWAEAVRDVAASKNVPLIDLHAKSIELLDRLGPAVSHGLGPVKTDGTLDKTHLNERGSALFGAVVAAELRRAAPELAPHVRESANLPEPLPPWSVRMAESVMKRTPDPMWLDATERPRWEYTPGLVLKGIMHVAERTGDARYWNYVERYYDGMIDENGVIQNYRLDEYNIDRINPGKPLFTLYRRTKKEKYRKAIETLRQQMREHPRTSEGGFWHKKRYPHQMWLDGLYMGAPFLAQYAKTFGEPALFDDVISQFVLMEKHARDGKSGLLYHGWDESRQQKWADPKTGRSPAFWGRAMGWYAMGLVETLEFVPLEHPRRRELIAILQRLAEAVVRVQDPKSGVWWQVLDQGGREKNYLEASVSTMLSFALVRAARLGYVDRSYGDAGRRAWRGVLKEFIEVDRDGLVNIHRVCQVAGLGGDPERGERYRDGTFDYYVTERIRSNDPKAVGPFLFASLEMEK